MNYGLTKRIFNPFLNSGGVFTIFATNTNFQMICCFLYLHEFE